MAHLGPSGSQGQARIPRPSFLSSNQSSNPTSQRPQQHHGYQAAYDRSSNDKPWYRGSHRNGYNQRDSGQTRGHPSIPGPSFSASGMTSNVGPSWRKPQESHPNPETGGDWLFGARPSHQSFNEYHQKAGGPHSNRPHDSNSQSQPRAGSVWQKFTCDPCGRTFSTEADRNLHVLEHVTCGIDGCTLSAHPDMILKHQKMQHFGLDRLLSRKLRQLTTPEEIAKWREERRKNFPTAEKRKNALTPRQDNERNGAFEDKSSPFFKRLNQRINRRNQGMNKQFGRQRGYQRYDAAPQNQKAQESAPEKKVSGLVAAYSDSDSESEESPRKTANASHNSNELKDHISLGANDSSSDRHDLKPSEAVGAATLKASCPGSNETQNTSKIESSPSQTTLHKALRESMSTSQTDSFEKGQVLHGPGNSSIRASASIEKELETSSREPVMECESKDENLKEEEEDTRANSEKQAESNSGHEKRADSNKRDKKQAESNEGPRNQVESNKRFKKEDAKPKKQPFGNKRPRRPPNPPKPKLTLFQKLMLKDIETNEPSIVEAFDAIVNDIIPNL